MRPRRLRPTPIARSAFARYFYPPDVIVLAVRWYQLPVMVCVDISATEEHEQVTKVVLGTEEQDLQLDRDLDGHYLIYDEHMQRLSVEEADSRQAFSVAADHTQWPARPDWEEGPDALRDPWLYDDGDLQADDPEDDGEAAGEIAAAGDPTV
jgi:hypothetical protein